jgi:protein SCO1/2
MSGRRVRLALFAAIATSAGAIALAGVLEQSSGGGHSASSSSAEVGVDSATGFAGAALNSGMQAPGFTLTDQSGRRVSLRRYRGQVTVLAFLSTTCGGPCVLAAQQIRGALDELARPVPVLLVSANPAVDTRTRVRSFLDQMSLAGRVHYLTGSRRQLHAVWRSYGVTPASAGGSVFARAVAVRLLDRGGHQRVLFGLEQLTPEGLAHDLRKLGADRLP